MRVAAIYDIHSNLSALEAVLQEIRQAKVDCVVVGGDVLPGPLPRETIQCLLDLDIPVQFIHGNGDREVLAQMSGVETDWYRTAPEQHREPVRWTAQQLDTQHQRLLERWPPTCHIKILGLGDVFFCHATPRNDTEIFTRHDIAQHYSALGLTDRCQSLQVDGLPASQMPLATEAKPTEIRII